MGKNRIPELTFDEIKFILSNTELFKHHPNEDISVCDPYYTPPILHPYEDNIDWDAEYDKCNAVYLDEIKADELRYPFVLEMEAKKKEMKENPIIFDKEEEYYETDPHKLVFFYDNFTPFFDQADNEIFFRNLRDPIRIKWEEIPEEDRKQRIVPLDQSVRKLQYDELDKYFTKYIMNKDLVLLFLKHMPNIWPISTFLGQFENYIEGKTAREIYEFFIEKILLLGSEYTFIAIKKNPILLTANENQVIKYMKAVEKIKEKLFKDILKAVKTKPVTLAVDLNEPPDILTSFFIKYDLYDKPKNEHISRIYNYSEISKIVLLLNLSFFNVFPILHDEFEKIRKPNRSLFVTFLWYLKDLYWDFYTSPLNLKKDIKSYFSDEQEYEKYSQMIEYYPSKMVHAKEYFYTHHNVILREVAFEYLDRHYEAEKAKEKEEYRFNADFYVLNKELQAFEKLKEKIYSKFRKLKKTPEETKEAIERAYEKHKRHQKYLSKILFKRKSLKVQKPKVIDLFSVPRDSLEFYIDETKEQTIERTYDELIKETTEFFIETLQILEVYDKICEEHKVEPKKYDEPDIYKKLLTKKLIEPNIWNSFNDYCYLAIDKYPDKITFLTDFFEYQKAFIEEFIRDVMSFWGKGKIVTPQSKHKVKKFSLYKALNPILKTRRRKTKL